MEPEDYFRNQLEKQGFAMSTTQGVSMRPLLWGGRHNAVVAPLDAEPAVGDMLAFEKAALDGSAKFILHRLVRIEYASDGSNTYITRGDNNLRCELVHRCEIIGRVVEIHRMSGWRPWHILPGRQFSVTDKAYLRYVRFWTAIWPLRCVYYRLRDAAYPLLRKLKHLILKN